MAETRAVAKAVLVVDDKILILRRSERATFRPLQWDLPGGGIDLGEDVKQACAREVLEEVGMRVPFADFKSIYAMTEPVAEAVSATFMFFMAHVPIAEVTLSPEHVEARWLTVPEALKLFTYERHQRVLQYVAANDLLHAVTSD